jgi:23S rRNA (guanine745-N1)-methyltransferase
MGPHARHLSRDGLAASLAALPEPVEVTVAVDLTTYAPSLETSDG